MPLSTGAAIPPLFDPQRSALAGASTGPPVGPAAAERWVQSQVSAYEDRYTTMQGFRVACCAFNVACKKPPPSLAFIAEGDPDMIAVGLQEVDMGASALIREETEAAQPWLQAMIAAVGGGGPQSPYLLLASRQLVGLYTAVFVRRPLAQHVKRLKVATVATGALGAVANKGAVGIRFQCHASTLCFINCHLAAHQNETERRNRDIAVVLSQLDLTPVAAIPHAATAAAAVAGGMASGGLNATTAVAVGPMQLPKDHDVCVVFGDLNYRVDLTYEAAVECCRRQDIKGLLKEDQLVRELGQRHTPWAGFTDLTPSFLPTYRFDVGTSTYDTSEKRRIPSFTDRVLVRTKPRHDVTVERLRACHDVVSSDHKPVLAMLGVPVKVVAPELRQAVVAQLRDTVARLGAEHAASPRIAVDTTALDFGRVSFLEAPPPQTVTISNNGECVAHVRSFRSVADDRCDGMWLRVSPCSLAVLPGQSVTVTVEAVVDWAALRWAVDQRPFLGHAAWPQESFLMVAADNGPTFCVDCTCAIVPTCFGSTLDCLLELQHLPAAEAFALGPEARPPPAGKPQVPKELWLLCDYFLADGAAQCPDLFEADGDPAEVDAVMAHLNTSAASLRGLGVHPSAVASALLLFLRDLQLPVVPPSHQQAAIHAAKAAGPAQAAACMAAVQAFPAAHYNAFLYIVAFLRFLLRPAFAEASGVTPELLGHAFALALFPLSTHARPQVEAAPVTPSAASPVAPESEAAAEQSLTAQTMTLRSEYETVRGAAVAFVLAFLTGRPELTAVSG